MVKMINDRILAIGVLCCIIAVAMFPAPLYHVVVDGSYNLISPILGQTKEDIKINCVTQILKANPQIIDNIEKHPEVVTALKTDNYSGLIVKEPIYITVTPTPDGVNYFAGQFSNGTRKLNRPFTIYRSNSIVDGVQNPYGNSTLEISTVVYDYLITSNFHYQNPEITNSPSGLGYTLVSPKDNQSEFLFVFLGIYTNNDVSTVRKVWLPDTRCFAVQIGDTVYLPKTDFPLQARIAELQSKRNLNKNDYAQAYGQYMQYIGQFSINKDSSSATYESFKQQGLAGETSIQDYYIPVGDSNIEDGYLVFEIPKDTLIENIDVLFQFFDFGYADWKLIL